RAGPPAKLSVEDQERQASEVIAVEMGQHDGVEVERVDAETPQRNERGRTAVEQDAARAGLDEDAGLESATTAEGVARSDEGDAHASGAPDRDDRIAQDLDGLVDLGALDHQWRAEHDQIAGAVDLAAGRVHDRASVERSGLDLLGHAGRGWIRLAARLVTDDLHGGHEPETSHVAHDGKIAEA